MGTTSPRWLPRRRRRQPCWATRRSLNPGLGFLVFAHPDVIHGHVDLGYLQAGHALEIRDHVLPNGLGDAHDRYAVVDHQVQVDSRLTLADFDAHALRGAGAAHREL